MATEPIPRGVCCHEAGHAVVAFSFQVHVIAVRVALNDEKGWHGATDTPPGSADNLPYLDRITLWSAGKAAEEFFECTAHECAWLGDFGEISSLLNRKGLLNELWPRINEGKARACVIFEKHRDQARRLTDRLVERGCIDDAEFLRLMTAV